MSIKPSAASEIGTLVESLSSSDEVRREGAIARLAVIGGRGVGRLARLYAEQGTSRDTRVAILRVLERTTDPRALPIARRAVDEGGDVAVAGVAALRSLLNAANADMAASALDALITAALNRDADHRVRAAAVDALQDSTADVRAQVATALGATTSVPRGQAMWQDAIEGRLPDDPAAFRDVVESRSGSAPLSDLQKLVEAARQREADVAGTARALSWRAVRGALHQALGLRHSSVALYDLRESVARAGEPLPATFIAALHAIGDESCLEPIAAAYSAATGDDRWRLQLAGAFQAIVARTKAGRTSVALKRIEKRWPAAAAGLNTTSRTTPRRKTRGRT